ncbi:MAG: hypothetical protein ACRBBR_00635 [Cellvibrionaceae bacterium]
MKKQEIYLMIALAGAIGVYLYYKGKSNQKMPVGGTPSVVGEPLKEEPTIADYFAAGIDLINPFNQSDAEAKALLGLDKDEFGFTPNEDPFADPETFNRS